MRSPVIGSYASLANDKKMELIDKALSLDVCSTFQSSSTAKLDYYDSKGVPMLDFGRVFKSCF